MSEFNGIKSGQMGTQTFQVDQCFEQNRRFQLEQIGLWPAPPEDPPPDLPEEDPDSP